MIDDGLTHSTPARVDGSSTGNIEINILSGAQTNGYDIIFDTNGKCKLYSEGQLIDQDIEDNNSWVLKHDGNIEITIQNDLDNPFVPMDRFLFSVLNDNMLFAKIKIE